MDVSALVQTWTAGHSPAPFPTAPGDCDPLPGTVVAHHPVAGREARFEPFPPWLHPDLVGLLGGRGIHQLYSHQARAADLLHGGRHTVVATPTASGKSLCYQLPVLDALLRRGDRSRSLFLYPTKALARAAAGEP